MTQLEEVIEIVERDVRPSVRSHLGDVEVTGVDAQGVVHVAFTGACTRCSYRKLTLLGALYPRVRAVEGVTGVAADGVPISQSELDRSARAFGVVR